MRVCLLLVLIFFSTSATASRHKKNAVRDQWQTLIASGCNIPKAHISTPIEARVLRNTPYAIAGKTFRSSELTALFRADGDWYQPKKRIGKLSSKDRQCIARIKAWERKLRKQLPIRRSYESMMTLRNIYLDFRQIHYEKDYGNTFHRQNSGVTSWGFDVSKRCKGDCSNYTVMCEKQKGKIACTIIAAG